MNRKVAVRRRILEKYFRRLPAHFSGSCVTDRVNFIESKIIEGIFLRGVSSDGGGDQRSRKGSVGQKPRFLAFFGTKRALEA